MFHNGYHFHYEQTNGVYNPTRILFELEKLQQIMQNQPPSANLSMQEQGKYLLNKIPSDPNTLPAKATLELISSNIAAPSVLSEVLASDNAVVQCQGGIAANFHLSHLNKIATDRRPLLSFLYYMGALTHQFSGNINVSPRMAYLTPPNSLARDEFLEEVKRMLHVREDVLALMHTGIMDMLQSQDLVQFTIATEKMLFGLRGRYAVVGEDAISQGMGFFVIFFHFSLIL